MESFIIESNIFLSKATKGYYNCIYTKINSPDHPKFITDLKNTFNNTSKEVLFAAKEEVKKRLTKDIPEIMMQNELSDCTVLCIPRAKAFESYFPEQLFFIEAVAEAAEEIPGVINGSWYIKRYKNTKTTHIKNFKGQATVTGIADTNDGELPYVGITKATCKFYLKGIRDRDIILVDDIYTKTCNIDEDCIQALYEAGARSVIFYAIGYTKRDL